MSLRDQILALLTRAETVPPPDVRRYGPASPAEIEGFEARLDRPFPDELRDWLAVRSGSYVGPGGLYGIRPDDSFLDIEHHFRAHPLWRDRGWIPVAGDGCGNTYLLDASSGAGDTHPVCFIGHETDQTRLEYVVASGLWRFLWFLLGAEEQPATVRRWPFAREFVLAHDPQIVLCTSAPLPWELED